jgi:hypothetical protein
MFIFPEDKSLISGLQTCYVTIPKLIEYYKKHVSSGCICFRGEEAEGVLFFKDQCVINGFFRKGDKVISGEKGIDRLYQASVEYDFSIDVLEIVPDQILFWSGIQAADAVYTNLSTEFTDLKRLLKKMIGENLNGYIDVDMNDNNERGRIFLAQGSFIGGTYSWIQNRLSPSKKDLENLIGKTKTTSGIFNVYSVPLPVQKPDTGKDTDQQQISASGITALEALIQLSEKIVDSNKKVKNEFQTLMKKKFVQNVDKYAFLDPFSKEFEYHDGKIMFRGKVEEQLLAQGVFASLQSVMEECKMVKEFAEKMDSWRQQFAGKAQGWGF